jgi:ABC-type Fe3+ transport system permease subunit
MDTNGSPEAETRRQCERPPFERWEQLYEVTPPNPTLLGAALAFLRSLNGPTLVAVLAVIGMVYIGASLIRAEKEPPTAVVLASIVSVVSLAVVALMALRLERTNRNATNGENRRDEPPHS